ncbi:hypothetical protein CLAFUW4_02361 [Fulvia fulva]|nr:hypothetical protein CLAFUR4_02356 [Fulvia fulva]KAK4632802.1 hypothetical protein CLAFUR0_02360 [Fulvia fulva]WPV11844.1 hypothetical protein CLAFUW4_02361 [Fulvia fulva]WPV26945.1 hypothetical protein CLAFUW7_02361 [Fulvia fulva]
MVQGASFEAISVLRDGSPQQKLDAVKHIKNIIVGQRQRKELAVKHGIIQPLADILSGSTKATGKRRLDSSGVSLQQSQEWTIDDELRLQAIYMVGSLASGGQPFLYPLCSADLPTILVHTLSADIGTRLTTATLQALNAIVSFWSTLDESSINYDLWGAVFTAESLEVFDGLLSQPNSSTLARQQLRLVADIISGIDESGPPSPNPRSQITNSGILDTLASLVVSHAVEHKLVYYSGTTSQLPPAPPATALPSILAAISTIITGSTYRAQRFILAPSVRDLFAHSGLDSIDHRASFGARHGFANPHESLLPLLHVPTSRSISHNPSSNSFPALKALQTSRNGNGSSESMQATSDIDHSNAVVGWLLVLARSMKGLNRLTALRLLALVANAIEADPVGASHRNELHQKTRERQRQLALLGVPLAAKLVQAVNEERQTDSSSLPQDGRSVKEQACAVLALLIKGSRDLQIAAVEAGTIKHVCPILKKSFDNVTSAKPMWSSRSATQVDPSAPATCHLGLNTLPSEISHAMLSRESALKAVEALAAREDIHRKAIIDAGVVSCIIDSLKPFSITPTAAVASNRTQIAPKDGNTTTVILAACRAAQSMSRSVSVLRTSLIDGGIAKPLIQLLQHASLEVQVAATDVCCNLLPDFSPMREEISEADVIKTLVEHARSSYPALRLSSLWALKHLVVNCPKETKFSTLEELGTGWLVGIIQGEQWQMPVGTNSTNNGGVSVGLSSANAAGEQVDLLNPSSMDVDNPGPTSDDIMEEDDEDGEVLFDEASNTRYQSSQLRSTLHPHAPAFNLKRYLSNIRCVEENDEYIARRDEAAIQTQALDFIRNLMNGEDCATLADHIMNQIGSNKVYELLTAKLLPLPRHLTSGTKVYHPEDLVLSTIHVIIHLANAGPKHRQMLIAQKPLLQAMLPHFSHSDSRVRVMSVWAVNSLTWIEEDGDRRDARARSNEIKALGIEQAVRALQSDSNLDVRERVKTAIRQFEAL